MNLKLTSKRSWGTHYESRQCFRQSRTYPPVGDRWSSSACLHTSCCKLHTPAARFWRSQRAVNTLPGTFRACRGLEQPRWYQRIFAGRLPAHASPCKYLCSCLCNGYRRGVHWNNNFKAFILLSITCISNTVILNVYINHSYRYRTWSTASRKPAVQTTAVLLAY